MPGSGGETSTTTSSKTLPRPISRSFSSGTRVAGWIRFSTSSLLGGSSGSIAPPGSSMGVFMRLARPTKSSQSSIASKSGWITGFV